MAIVLAKTLGYHFCNNFEHPYVAKSIQDFWRRWHISRSTWLRDYLYIPLGGNRNGRIRTGINLMVTMTLGGLWHGAAWTFVAWGVLHGAALLAHRHILSGFPFRGRIATCLGWAATMIVVLTGWVLDLRSARHLGMAPTGQGARGLSSPPGPASSNVYLQPGASSQGDLVASIRQGLYVTELIGSSINMVTGDYSRGASGYWIENGELTYPVSEITIAGNLKDMFRSIEPADDLEFRTAVNAPTCRVEGLTIAGL